MNHPLPFATPVTRRTLCRSAAGGLATLLGMPVRGLLAGEPGVVAREPRADSVILLWMGGGMSHIDTFDPKPGAKTGGEFAAIRTAVDGATISEILPTTATPPTTCSQAIPACGNSCIPRSARSWPTRWTGSVICPRS
jgi:hypothetical protein